MKTFVLAFVLIVFSAGVISAQPIPPDSLYLGQTPPGNTPEIFHLLVNPGSFAAERIAISGDNKEIYYTEVHSYYPTAGDTIKYYRYSGNHWIGPFNLFRDYMAPALSVLSDTLYFQNNSSVYESFFSARNGANWSNPKRLLANLNSAHYLQVTNNRNYYVSSHPESSIGGNDWCRLLINEGDSSASSLGLPVNSNADNLDFFISRDESFMIVSKNGLQVSYHKSDNTWTNPKNLGPAINFGLNEWGPYVSADSKYLFYTTGTIPDYSDTYIYWVRIDNLLDSLKYTNYVPYLKNKIPDQDATVGQFFNYTIPDSTFVDDDGNNTLAYSAKLVNGSPLPAWLVFDSITGNFSGTPVAAGILNIRITATDTAGASASTTLRMRVAESTGTGQPEEHRIRIFPNPTGGNVNISLEGFETETGNAEVTSISGVLFLTQKFRNNVVLDLSDKPKGLYILKLQAGEDIFFRKICVE